MILTLLDSARPDEGGGLSKVAHKVIRLRKKVFIYGFGSKTADEPTFDAAKVKVASEGSYTPAAIFWWACFSPFG